MAPENLHSGDVNIGDEIGPVQRMVGDDQVKEFQSIWWRRAGPTRFSDPEFARRSGLPGPIVPGPMTTALISQLLTGWSPTVSVKKLDLVFRQVVPHNVSLRVSGVVTNKIEVRAEPIIECDVTMEDEEGSQLVIGNATVTLPMR